MVERIMALAISDLKEIVTVDSDGQQFHVGGEPIRRIAGVSVAKRFDHGIPCGIEHLWTAGALSTHASAAYPGARHFDEVAALVAALGQAPEAASIVVKGSRFMKMEQVVAALAAAGPAGGSHAA